MAITNTGMDSALAGPTLQSATRPVTLEETKRYGRIDGSDEDLRLQDAIDGAVTYIQHATRRHLIQATYLYYLPGFPAEIELPRPPLISVTSIAYIDADGASQTLASSTYQVNTASTPGRVRLAYGKTWPVTRDDYNAVTVTYLAGYGTAGTDVPQPLRLAVMALAVHNLDNPEALLIGAPSSNMGFGPATTIAAYKVAGAA